MSDSAAQLERVVDAVLAGAAYRPLSRDLVQRVAAAELAKRRNEKETIKATRSKLHQAAKAYLPDAPRYASWLAELRAARATGDAQSLRDACRRVMAFHTSTRERLPILDEFYAATLAPCGPIHSVLDVACGLNPLATPWMPLAPGAEYIACDVITDAIAFVDAFLQDSALQQRAVVCDVLGGLPEHNVDVALVLKTIPCLEHMDKDAAPRLLDAINARWVLVSFPVHSLGGRSKGMLATYEARFMALASTRPWQVQPFRFAAELAFLVRKDDALSR